MIQTFTNPFIWGSTNSWINSISSLWTFGKSVIVFKVIRESVIVLVNC